MAQGIKGLPEKRREDTGQGETATRMWQPPPSPVTDPEEASDRTLFFRANQVGMPRMAFIERNERFTECPFEPDCRGLPAHRDGGTIWSRFCFEGISVGGSSDVRFHLLE